MKVHRLVAMTYIGQIDPPLQVNHKNGHKADNRLENLEIVTPSQNTKHGFDVLGRVMVRINPPRGECHANARWRDKDILTMRRLYVKGWTQKRIAKRFKTHQSKISEIVRLEAWSHVK